MTSFLLINLIAIILLAKKLPSKYSISLIGVLSLITALSFNQSLLKLSFLKSAPAEILLFYAVALIELIKGKTKNTALIILLSLSTLLQKNDYLYIIQILLYVFLTLKDSVKNLVSKVKLLVFLSIWPTSVIVQNLYPSSQINTFLPILMSYLTLLKGQESRKTSNELLFSIIISQLYFLQIASDLVLPENYTFWLFPILTIATAVSKKANKYIYPLIVIIPIIMFPSISQFVLSMLFFIKVISNDEINKKIELHTISNLNILKIVMLFIVVVVTLLNFNQFTLILFIFITYFLSPQRSPISFVSDKSEDFRHLIALTFLLFLSLGKLAL